MEIKFSIRFEESKKYVWETENFLISVVVISKECFVHELLNYHPRGVNLKNNFGVIYQLCFTCVIITQNFFHAKSFEQNKNGFCFT